MKTNLVLIGLMGSGKTTVGRLLSGLLGMEFIDVDEDIEQHFGPIPTLFEKGEGYFRELENERIRILSRKSNAVISTGGGAILDPSNMEALKKNGLVFYLDRPIGEIIATVDPAGRPLLKNGPEALYRLKKEREAKYLQYSDHVIRQSQPDAAASEIISLWNQRL